jgi:catechol 2,3-dioxygenase-like lactoylglutathione lyase family enzyme
MRFLRSTPVLYVSDIESCLRFWRDALGFAVTAEVPHGDRLGFAILERDGQEVMLQTPASAEADLPPVASRTRPGVAALYHEVDSLDAARASLGSAKVLAGPRVAPYGMREIFVEDAAGFVHGFAERLR